jgi:hypothetical protein
VGAVVVVVLVATGVVVTGVVVTGVVVTGVVVTGLMVTGVVVTGLAPTMVTPRRLDAVLLQPAAQVRATTPNRSSEGALFRLVRKVRDIVTAPV